MRTSGLRISTPEGRSMSPAVTSPGPVTTSGASISAASECMRQTISLRLRTMSVTSSLTPLIVENSWATPSMRTLVTAAPASDDSSTRRSELPKVYPKPRSSGSIVNEPRFSSTVSLVIRGTWKSSIRVLAGLFGPCARAGQRTGRVKSELLLRVQLDDQLLLDGSSDLAALGTAQDLRGERVVVRLKPGGH